MQHQGDDGGACSVCSISACDDDCIYLSSCNTMDASKEHAEGGPPAEGTFDDDRWLARRQGQVLTDSQSPRWF